MSEQLVKSILKQFCAITNLAEAEKFYATLQLTVNDIDVDFSLVHSGEQTALRIEIDLGAVANERERDVYRKLLEINLLSDQATPFLIGIDSSSSHPVLSSTLFLTSETTGYTLLNKLNHALEQAQFLRETVIYV